jgi:hypothetical protein
MEIGSWLKCCGNANFTHHAVTLAAHSKTTPFERSAFSFCDLLFAYDEADIVKCARFESVPIGHDKGTCECSPCEGFHRILPRLTHTARQLSIFPLRINYRVGQTIGHPPKPGIAARNNATPGRTASLLDRDHPLHRGRNQRASLSIVGMRWLSPVGTPPLPV